MAKSDTIKTGLHPRNKHRGRYNFDQLIQANAALASFVKLNKYDETSIDFSNTQDIKTLNQALHKQFYAIASCDIPKQHI